MGRGTGLASYGGGGAGCSRATRREVELAVRRILDEAAASATALLTRHRARLEAVSLLALGDASPQGQEMQVADALVRRKELDRQALVRLLRDRPADAVTYDRIAAAEGAEVPGAAR